jgi:hypothetical protein
MENRSNRVRTALRSSSIDSFDMVDGSLLVLPAFLLFIFVSAMAASRDFDFCDLVFVIAEGDWPPTLRSFSRTARRSARIRASMSSVSGDLLSDDLSSPSFSSFAFASRTLRTNTL